MKSISSNVILKFKDSNIESSCQFIIKITDKLQILNKF